MLMLMLIKIDSIYDLISLISLFANLYFLFSMDIVLIIGCMFCILLHNILKEITYGWCPPIFKRPNGATDCSLFNTGGLVDHKSGFPSGHVTAISFLMSSLLLRRDDLNFKNIIQYNIPVLLVAYARIMKGCHNLIQVVAGYLLGYGVAYTLHIYKREVTITIDEIKTYISDKISQYIR